MDGGEGTSACRRLPHGSIVLGLMGGQGDVFERLTAVAKQADCIWIGARTAGEAPLGLVLVVGGRVHRVAGAVGHIGATGLMTHCDDVDERTLEKAFASCRRLCDGAPLRFESVKVRTQKSPLSARELTPLVVEALGRVFEQQVPDPQALKRLRKLFSAELKDEEAALAHLREKVAAKEKIADEAEIAAARAARQPVQAVTDVPSFLAALGQRIGDAPRISKATKMLQKAGFQLYHDIADDQVVGVVKSQNDPTLVYACRLAADGSFSCCTQNLNACGGLRGKACKHLLVLLIGLVQSGELEAAQVDRWLDHHLDRAPVLDRDAMGDVFLKYKGAEAGDVDWRPTETMPEDFYAY